WVQMAYSERGTVKNVGGSYGALVTDIKRTADGLHQHIEYGDLAATRTAFAYDNRRRLSSVQTYRGLPSAWNDPSSSYSHAGGGGDTFQKVLQNDQYIYDVVGNPTRIEDLRNPDEWPSGAKPVTRAMEYDDLYRVTRVDYGYSQGDDTIAKFEVILAPMGVGPAGFRTRVTPRLSAQQLANLQKDLAERPDPSSAQIVVEPAVEPTAPEPVGAHQAPTGSLEVQAPDLDKARAAAAAKTPDLSAVPNADPAAFVFVTTTAPS